MVEGRNGYTPPADYRAPDFVRQWSDSATRGADRIEQEREQRTRDGERDAAQRAQDGQRALEQSSQDAQRAAGQVARDAQRAAEQLARDEGRAATSTAARASYDLDRSGEGAQRGLAYSHGSANDALLRRRAQPPTQAPSSAPTPHPGQAPSAGQAPVPPPAPQQATPGVDPTPAVPKSRAAKGPAAKNAAHLGQPGLGPGFAVFAGLAAVVSAFLGYWIPVVIAIMFSAGPIKRGFTSGAKGIAVSILAILLLAAGAAVQILQVLPGASGTDETEAVTESTPVGLEGDPIESGTLPEFTLQAGSPVGGFGEANLDVVLPEGAGQLAVLQVDDKVGGLSASMYSGDQVVEFQYLERATGGTAQWLINTQAAVVRRRPDVAGRRPHHDHERGGVDGRDPAGLGAPSVRRGARRGRPGALPLHGCWRRGIDHIKRLRQLRDDGAQLGVRLHHRGDPGGPGEDLAGRPLRHRGRRGEQDRRHTPALEHPGREPLAPASRLLADRPPGDGVTACDAALRRATLSELPRTGRY
ncbi:hypothetical protein [Pseudoclavibacter terrae]|uniref:hypothetical protein n=1 Tax=Pseudoclavibacter terrae TaxID=1530195 RepID=UPI00232AE433|nr:hypothetical protein [Pseudoclavibacter terrae]